MPDPRLNSVHLDPIRREQFRQARGKLLGARGECTLYAEVNDSNDPDTSQNTFLQNDYPREHLPADLECWLVDREFVYPLKVGVNTLGRSPDNDVVVADAFISRRHCAILVHSNQGCELYDVASKNGTFLNGSKLNAPTPLQSGDEIRVCDRQFIFLTRKGEQARPGHSPTLAR